MSVVQAASQEFEKFKAAYSKNDLKTAESILAQLKLKLIQFPALPPLFEKSATAQQELLLAREVLEHAVLLAVKQASDDAMERRFLQLKTFYADTRGLIPASPQEHPMLGLDLLRLLVQNRIAEFHTELELISVEDQESQYIKLAIQLEQWLMVGAYNKVLEASKHAPSEFHASLMQQLASTVRDEVASCSERSYNRLRVTDAQKLMMFDSAAAVREYAEKHEWHVQDQYIVFQQQDAPAAQAIPSLTVINNALMYAKELERIV
mmetsp:Transcript_12269/g.26462  ORF Transcript_12269/g.26462 Transcript_12269/m.26462 type:complete len:264 (+) Transcript_12269:65-856(+)|eukprot:CAMPEP_0202892534 /NCGR_PEP_ID=MMETSP1392-20130828/2252_1 /ASSEMBLY_ACC=CAM_ASM_000868 /TAXON_ID=225041 /ORGANISM="Chlamydomonas chlamydogama, Strain SAG 11-48b" /LENGTH=263 /DNA_ID=CAMNT_0049576525 /DNA_START=46 /DNA_END=837 /DNA_ORIENTATION=-